MENLIRNLKRPYRGTQEEIIKHVERYCKAYNYSYTNLVIGTPFTTFTVYSNISYEELVAKLVAEKYTQAEESAIQRKAIMNGIKDEFLTYNTYVEECKTRAKEFIAQREKALGGNN